MNALSIELTKLVHDGVVLRCTRADGSVTHQRNEGDHGRFFAFHDLRHYAVETILGYTDAFYGLIASGWDIADTTGKGARGSLPGNALIVEHLVGLLDADNTNANASSAIELNRYAASFAAEHHRPEPPLLSDEDLSAIRNSISSLHSQWLNLPEGSTMKLLFPPSLDDEFRG